MMKVQKKSSKLSGRRRHSQRRSKFQTFTSAVGTVALVGGLVVVGYCIGGPVLHLFGKEEAPAVNSGTDSFLSAENTTAASDTTTDTTSTSETAATTTTTTAPAAIAVNAQNFIAGYVSADAMESPEALNAALQNFSAGETVILPLKLAGGTLCYASDVTAAKNCGAVTTELTLDEISAALRAHELTAIPQISTLNDNLYPAFDYDAGYFFADDHSRWLDNSPEKDGKPWMSPFSENGTVYLQAIVAELTDAGFPHILCTDVSFPPFYSSDLDHIGALVKSKESRTKALAGVLNALQQTAEQHGGSVMTEFSLYDAMNRDVEYLSPILLGIPNAVVMIDMHSFHNTLWYGNEKVQLTGKSVTEILNTVLPIAEEMTGEVAVIPCLKRSSLSDAEFTEATEALQAMGYTRYCLK